MSDPFRDAIRELQAANAKFLLVGAHALAIHGVPRATADLDIFVAADKTNAKRVWQALAAFGAPLESLGITVADLAKPDIVAQIGVPPYRIDVLTGLTGVRFKDAWARRFETTFEGLAEVPVISREDLIRNKRATGRTRDLADVEALGEI